MSSRGTDESFVFRLPGHWSSRLWLSGPRFVLCLCPGQIVLFPLSCHTWQCVVWLSRELVHFCSEGTPTRVPFRLISPRSSTPKYECAQFLKFAFVSFRAGERHEVVTQIPTPVCDSSRVFFFLPRHPSLVTVVLLGKQESQTHNEKIVLKGKKEGNVDFIGGSGTAAV